eukprot:CAMPEP_0183306804 /NCGR_PEP_ID=MMETSP0160_2-20130417/14466_1 /TAXON_ID=2839 ORGANISM="Odontella Sinensis, Strain Grunow 1884" /NCGR_SAMPLE_ID=MMETSP0160_2 /ASSEMBLY_ACC=CAM_ASM_000250 /LENGTH=252 /DNA_ID=CAMNT_0025470267 /DNA_START=100 /DNA_END=858 /DNA_ORIENTATION=+
MSTNRRYPFLCAVVAALWNQSAVGADQQVRALLRKTVAEVAERAPAQERRSLTVDQDSCYTCDSSPCTTDMDEVFHFKHCSSWYMFVQCSEHGHCHSMQCAPGTAWNQDYRTCCHIQDDKLRCCKDGVCELLPFGTDAPTSSPTSQPTPSSPDGEIGNRQENCDESSDYSDEGPGSFSGDDPKTTYYPMEDIWPPPFDVNADYWCSSSDECDCDACCGVWADTWFVCIPISDAKALGNVCHTTLDLGGLGGL